MINSIRTVPKETFKNMVVAVKCEFNVPLDKKYHIFSCNIRKDGMQSVVDSFSIYLEKEIDSPSEDLYTIFDTIRIKRVLPTIEYFLECKAKIVLFSHLGDNHSNEIIAEVLDKSFGRKANVKFVPYCIGDRLKEAIDSMKENEIILTENPRKLYFKEEKGNDLEFSKKIASLCDYWVNDAFGTSHRKHATMYGVPLCFDDDKVFSGLLLEREMKKIDTHLDGAKRIVVILGGNKGSLKIEVIPELLKDERVEVYVGGLLSQYILRGAGKIRLGEMPDKKLIKLISKIDFNHKRLFFPEHYIMETDILDGESNTKSLDIGRKTILNWTSRLRSYGRDTTIFLLGLLGWAENNKYEHGTLAIAKAIIENNATVGISGGGDTNCFLEKQGLRNSFEFDSSGGGALSAYLAYGKEIHGLKAIDR